MRLLGKSLVDLQKLIIKGEISQKELWHYFKKRVEKYDHLINSFVTKPTDDEGIPLAIKDNFSTKGIRTTASSKVLDEYIPPYNATVVQRLLAKSFGVFGKTNMDAWAHGSSTETSDYGPTKNPWDITRAAGGSSGGSAAAVAAGLAPAAMGTETAGSIRQPAAWCGVVGFKPTYGRVSRYGVIAMGSSWDCPGPITQTVEDAAHLLQVVAGHDPYDATSSPLEIKSFELGIKKNLKVGISEDYLEGLESEVRKRFDEALDILQKLGHKIIKIKLLSPKYAISVYTILQRAEVSSNLARYDGVRYGNDRTFFGTEAKRRIMLGTYTLSHGYYDAYYKKAEKVRMLILGDFKKAFQEVDLIAAPTAPSTAIKLDEFEKYPFFGEMMDKLNEPAAAAGIPAINVPGGLDSNNLPVGIQFMGRHMDEETLLQLSHQFEKETDFFGIRQKLLEKYPD